MAVIVVATPGAPDANSYVTVEEADAYLEARLNSSAWTGDNRAAAVIEATRELDLAYRWKGYRVTDVQALSWPRRGVINEDASLEAPIGMFTGYPEYDYDVVPERLKQATIELAHEFLRSGTADLASISTDRGVVRKKIDVIETEWEPGSRVEGLRRFPRVVRLISPLIADGSRVSHVIRS